MGKVLGSSVLVVFADEWSLREFDSGLCYCEGLDW